MSLIDIMRTINDPEIAGKITAGVNRLEPLIKKLDYYTAGLDLLFEKNSITPEEINDHLEKMKGVKI